VWIPVHPTGIIKDKMKTFGTMKYIRIAVLTLILTVLNGYSFAQNSRNQRNANQGKEYSISGRIIDGSNGGPLELVNITFENNSFWAVSDLEGKFSLKLRNGEYHYEVSYIGYETVKGILKVEGKDITNFNIKMAASSLALEEVTVTAKQQAMGSSSVIDQTALQHLQPKSIEDILQLLPGNVTQNPDVNSIGQTYIREISGSNNNAMGALIMVDGAPVANDASLQIMSTSKSGSSMNSVSSGQSSTGRGVDLRTISTDNIENLEVIRGIPSVEYGNLTSGAVLIKTKKGATPLEAKAKIDPTSKMFYAGKGFNLGAGGTVNMALDYTESYNDVRYPAKGFERVTGDISYGKTFFNQYPLSFNLKVSYFQNVYDIRKDKQQQSYEVSKSENRGIRINLNGDWNIKRTLISNLSYNISYDNSWQRDYQLQQIVLTTGVTPIAVSTESGEFRSNLLNGTYRSEYTINGNPVDLFAQLKGTKTILISDGFSSSFKEGVEFKYDVNHGSGLEFDPKAPPFVRNVQTVRPRPYSDIPAMQTFSAFVENKTIMPIGKTSLTAQVGVRANRLLIDRNYLDRSDMNTIEPRFNVEWSFLTPKNSAFDNFSISAGWGLTSKMPPLVYLYPDKAYYDDKSFTYVDPSMNLDQSIAIMTTKVLENTSNPELKPSTGNKFEVGLNFAIKKMSGNVTFFMENYENEFTYRSIPFTFSYRTYLPPAGATDYQYENGVLTCVNEGSRINVDYRNDSVFQSYSLPMNGNTTNKMGVEYSFNLGQIKALRTSVVIDGAWLWVKRRNAYGSWSTISVVDPVVDSRTNPKKEYPFQAFYPAGSGSIESRVNTNFRFITHIPKISLIFSTTAQIVWSETGQSIYQDSDGNDIWYLAPNQQSSSGELRPHVDPVGFRDYAGNYYEWNTNYRNKANYRREYEMVNTYTYATNFEKTTYPTSVIINLRLTKQFADYLEISFMANNLFNTRKIFRDSNNGSYTNLAIPQYFGAEIKIKI